MTNGVRVERHDHEVVAKTIEAKRALNPGEMRVLSKMEALRMAKEIAHSEMRRARDAVAEADSAYAKAAMKWAEACDALDEAERQTP